MCLVQHSIVEPLTDNEKRLEFRNAQAVEFLSDYVFVSHIYTSVDMSLFGICRYCIEQ